MASPPGNLLGFTLPRLREALAPIVDRSFRADQIYRAIHRRGVTGFEAMTDLSAALRAELTERFTLELPQIAEQGISSDGTTKYLLRLADGSTIELVDIPDGDRRTLCLSSQAGCALACSFCVTGYWGAGRNLSTAEIVGQVLRLRQAAELPPSFNLVFMGMGEPLLNLDALRDAVEILGETISPRRMTVSTAGIVPGIEALGRWQRRPNLAISLHATDDLRRDRLMPINRSWPIASLIEALRSFPLEPRRRITIEYLLLADFNDSVADADALARLLSGLRVKVNVIPLNPDPVLPGWMRRPSDGAIERFRDRLQRRGLTATVRRQRGHDVAAACGQLRASGRTPHGLAARHRARDSAS